MTCDGAFKFYSYLLLIVSFLTLVFSGGISIALASVYLGATAISWRYQLRFLAGRFQLVVVLALMVWLLVDSVLVTSLMDSLIHLLLLVSLVKLFSLKTGRDYLILYLISFVYVLLASSYTLSIFFVVGLGVYLFCAILTFMLHETRKAHLENRKIPFSHGAYLQMAGLVTGLIVLLSIPLFIVIPRTPFGFLATNGRGMSSLTGFSNRVSLGEMGPILSDSRMVMRVKVDVDLELFPAEVKWRGVGLDHFDGKTWVNSLRHRQEMLHQGTSSGFLVPRSRRPDEFLVRQEFYVEPFTNLIFAAPNMITYTRGGGHRGVVVPDANDCFYFLPHPSGRVIYTVYSDVSSRRDRVLRARLQTVDLSNQGVIPVDREILPRFLQKPALAPGIARLAETITVGTRSPLDAALAIERYLKRNYTYDLSNKAGGGQNPLHDFLFVHKSGHCEYFATAQAVLMRSLGIPCRLVNGFRQGEYNNWSGHFVVRQSDAHSWVEGYFGRAGWIEFDPTPSGRPPSPYLIARISSEWLDALDTFWTELMSFDRMRQITLFHSFGLWLTERWEGGFGISRQIHHAKTAVYLLLGNLRKSVTLSWLWLLSPIVVGFVAYRYRRFIRLLIRKDILRRSSDQLAPDYYLEMLEILRKKGHIKNLAETPREFAVRLTPATLAEPAIDLTETYYRNRFGNVPLRSADVSAIRSVLSQIRRASAG